MRLPVSSVRRWRRALRDSVEAVRAGELHSKTLARIGLRELSLIILLCLMAGGVWAFVGIADEISEGELESFDRTILLALRTVDDVQDPLGPVWFEEVMRDVTALGGNLVVGFVTLASATYLLLLGKRRVAAFVLSAIGSGVLVGSLLKVGFSRPRPDLVEHATAIYTSSFPSGHSMTAGIVYLTLAAVLIRVQPRRRLKLYLLALAVLVTLSVGVSRVYLGVHWPSDVLAGWAAGAAWAIFWWCLALWMMRRGALEEGWGEAGRIPPGRGESGGG